MTTATLPTKTGVSVGNKTTQLWCDSLSNLKFLTNLITLANGTNYNELKFNNASYSVPASTNGRIYGIDNILIVSAQVGTTLVQLGYDDDGAGTNFTSLADVSAIIGNAESLLAAGSTVNGFSIGMVTVPTGKHVTIKATSGGIGKFALSVLLLETA